MNETTFRKTREIRSCLFGKTDWTVKHEEKMEFIEFVPGRGVLSLPIHLAIVGILDEIQ